MATVQPFLHSAGRTTETWNANTPSGKTPPVIYHLPNRTSYFSYIAQQEISRDHITQNSYSILHTIITEGNLEPCHLHLVLSICLIALVVVAVNITKSKNIIVGHVDNTKCR